MQVEIDKKDTKLTYQINYTIAQKTCKDFLRQNKAHDEIDVEGLIAQNIEAIRHNRTFARQQRFKLPMSFCYR